MKKLYAFIMIATITTTAMPGESGSDWGGGCRPCPPPCQPYHSTPCDRNAIINDAMAFALQIHDLISSTGTQTTMAEYYADTKSRLSELGSGGAIAAFKNKLDAWYNGLPKY